MNTTAGEIAKKLREIADRFDTQPDAEMRYAFLHLGAENKQQFLNAAQLIPRPFTKSIVKYAHSGDEIRLEHDDPAVHIWAMAPLDLACRLISPARAAVYECEPLLSQTEEESLVEP